MLIKVNHTESCAREPPRKTSPLIVLIKTFLEVTLPWVIWKIFSRKSCFTPFFLRQLIRQKEIKMTANLSRVPVMCEVSKEVGDHMKSGVESSRVHHRWSHARSHHHHHHHVTRPICAPHHPGHDSGRQNPASRWVMKLAFVLLLTIVGLLHPIEAKSQSQPNGVYLASAYQSSSLKLESKEHGALRRFRRQDEEGRSSIYSLQFNSTANIGLLDLFRGWRRHSNIGMRFWVGIIVTKLRIRSAGGQPSHFEMEIG